MATRPPRLQAVALAGLRELLAAGTPAWVSVTSASMAPTLLPGDEILLAPLSPGGPRLGDVVAFADGDTVVVHRYLFCRGENLVTLADGGARIDTPVDRSRVLGRVAARRRAGVEVSFGAAGSRLRGLLALARLGWAKLLGPIRRARDGGGR